MWLAQILSVAGDQLARVALTVLVYDRTTSPLLAAVTYAASFVPSFVGGVTLSALADRNPRRAVMIVCDLLRAAMVLVMAIPGVPIAALIVLLCAVTLVGAPFTSARAAVYPTCCRGTGTCSAPRSRSPRPSWPRSSGSPWAARWSPCSASARRCRRRGHVRGLGADRPPLDPVAPAARPAARPQVRGPADAPPAPPATAAAASAGGRERRGYGLVAGVRLVFGRPALRDPMLFGWLCAFYNAPEGIAVPLARSLGGGSLTVA